MASASMCRAQRGGAGCRFSMSNRDPPEIQKRGSNEMTIGILGKKLGMTQLFEADASRLRVWGTRFSLAGEESVGGEP